MLLAATDYNKFVSLMRLKAKELERKWRSEAKAGDAFENSGDSKEQAQVVAAVAAMGVGKGDSKGGDSEESEEDGGWIDNSRADGDEEDSSLQAESKSARK
jgi:hypothetical protein